jgi:hypothetical protein
MVRQRDLAIRAGRLGSALRGDIENDARTGVRFVARQESAMRGIRTASTARTRAGNPNIDVTLLP